MNEKTLRVAKPVLVAATLATIVWVSAGDLNPPPGPITATNRVQINQQTMTWPYVISTSGSYVLTSNLVAPSGYTGNGIEIAANGVTLDLMGFDLLGVPGSLDGVQVSVNKLTDIAVVNGSIRNWGADGVDLFVGNTGARSTRAADLRVSGNTAIGIRAGMNAIVTGCAASGNGSTGIFAGSGSTITGCTAFFNTGDGIKTASRGITITNCSAHTNGGNGIAAVSGCTVSNCSAESNSGDGIIASSGSMITDCSSRQNFGDGIRVIANCAVRGNTCDSNGFDGAGAGIRVTGSLNANNRIEGNNCVGNNIGIDVDQPGNFITRNTCSDNTTNWDIVAGNVCLVINATTSGAIVGNSGGVDPGSTDPNANFTY